MAGRVTPLKLALLEQGLKQKDVADAIGVSESRMSFIVRGLHVDDATRQQIADHVGRTVDQLWPSTNGQAAA